MCCTGCRDSQAGRLPNSGALNLRSPSGLACRRASCCLSQGAWWAVQEAAKQCVALRLRTHLGGPAQTLAALEQAVLAAVAALQQEQPLLQPQAQQAPGQGQGGSGDEAPVASSATIAAGGDRRQAAVLLLLFLQALEQGVASASSGASGASRASAPEGAVAFFAANSKVGCRWMLLLLLAACPARERAVLVQRLFAEATKCSEGTCRFDNRLVLST